jgi:hypothetical protein
MSPGKLKDCKIPSFEGILKGKPSLFFEVE